MQNTSCRLLLLCVPLGIAALAATASAESYIGDKPMALDKGVVDQPYSKPDLAADKGLAGPETSAPDAKKPDGGAADMLATADAPGKTSDAGASDLAAKKDAGGKAKTDEGCSLAGGRAAGGKLPAGLLALGLLLLLGPRRRRSRPGPIKSASQC